MADLEQKDVDLGLGLGVKKSGKKSLKRKRAEEIVGEGKVSGFVEEMESLVGFYKEFSLKKDGVLCVEDLLGNGGVGLDSAIAVVMVESSLPLSRLVEYLFEKLRGRFGGGENGGGISLGVVKSKVILIGQRCYYGVCNADADVLEDDSESALWCWETRDLKLMPKSTRNLLKIRRTCRKKIHERIMALSSMIDILKNPQLHEHRGPDLVKASEKLGKILNEEDIRKLVESMAHKNDTEMADNEAKHGEKRLIKQLEKSKREAEKEKKRATRELQKEKLQSEKEQKKLQDEAEKETRRREKEESRRREKEESEKRKQLKKQQEELEKDHQRQEKEKMELKMQTSLQKQASLMEKFLKKAKSTSTSQGDQHLQKVTPTTNGDDKMDASVTQSMDSILSLKNHIDSENLWRCHLNSWKPLRHSRKLHWSIRQKPKRELVKELKLSTNTETCHDEELSTERVGNGWIDQSMESVVCHANTEVSPSPQKLMRYKQLLQFDKANRPAFYGFWPKKSEVVKARRPFVKDPDLDYEIDSDEEWEEEEPGESLSDCDKDDEDETLEEGCSRGEEEEENEDGFFVPDGYLSESEGVEVEKMDLDELSEGRNLPTSEALQFEEFTLQLKQQKYLHNMTEHALQKNQPLVILNLSHEKASLLLDEDLTGTDKIEKMCLQALSMCAFPDSPPIDILGCNDVVEENQEACSTQSNRNILPAPTEAAIPDSDLPQIIAAIRLNNQGISKIIEVLQQKLPNTSKSQLRNKVREIADYCDNRWQVKRDILVKFGLASSPEIIRGKNQSIATFFSKRCQPPGEHFNPNETSPPSAKPLAASQPQHCSTSTQHT